MLQPTHIATFQPQIWQQLDTEWKALATDKARAPKKAPARRRKPTATKPS